MYTTGLTLEQDDFYSGLIKRSIWRFIGMSNLAVFPWWLFVGIMQTIGYDPFNPVVVNAYFCIAYLAAPPLIFGFVATGLMWESDIDKHIEEGRRIDPQYDPRGDLVKRGRMVPVSVFTNSDVQRALRETARELGIERHIAVQAQQELNARFLQHHAQVMRTLEQAGPRWEEELAWYRKEFIRVSLEIAQRR